MDGQIKHFKGTEENKAVCCIIWAGFVGSIPRLKSIFRTKATSKDADAGDADADTTPPAAAAAPAAAAEEADGRKKKGGKGNKRRVRSAASYLSDLCLT